MKYIKTFESLFLENTNNNVNFSLYTLTEHTHNESMEVGTVYTDKEEAISEAEMHDSHFPDTDSSIELTEYEFNIPYEKFIEILDYTEEDIKEDNISLKELIEEFKNNITWSNLDEYFEIESEIIEEIDYTNKSTDKLIDEVILKLNEKFLRNWRNGFSKYTTLYKDEEGNLTFEADNDLEFDDENYKEYEPVTIRIADHTHNPRNGLNDLNVLISNDDKTGNRFFTARTDLVYKGDTDVDEIVNDIMNYWK